jgi:hypothetical protein
MCFPAGASAVVAPVQVELRGGSELPEAEHFQVPVLQVIQES